MGRPRLKTTALWAMFSALAALAVLTSSTYAWFTFRTYTNVTPLAGAICHGDGNLLISDAPDGAFSTSCELRPLTPEAELLPLTTADLEHFWRVRRQDAAGLAEAYADASATVETRTLCGSVYLMAQDCSFDVYLWLPSLDCGRDAQSLAAMRLGLQIQTRRGVETHIFRLDELGDTTAAASQLTVPQAGRVVLDAAADGTPVYVDDPAVALSDYAAQGTEERILPGGAPLCVLEKDEVAQVRYWLYLEGCDEQCINPVQGGDIALQLGFAGIEQVQ